MSFYTLKSLFHKGIPLTLTTYSSITVALKMQYVIVIPWVVRLYLEIIHDL